MVEKTNIRFPLQNVLPVNSLAGVDVTAVLTSLNMANFLPISRSRFKQR